MRSVAFASGLVLASATWEDYKFRYGKVYNGDDEDAAHQATYEANAAAIAEQNGLNDGLTYGENQFTDLTQEQFKVAGGFGFIPSEKKWGALPHLGVHSHNGEKLADSVDWTTQGAVTAVKDQGQCGSCWSFSSTGGLEGAWQLATGQLTSMSEQYLVDCSTSYNEGGCHGGSMENAFVFVKDQGIATEASYPYTATDGSCKSSFQVAIPANSVQGYMTVAQNIDAFKSAIANGPVSIAIQADQSAFQMYHSGVLESTFFHRCGTQLDHGVLAVGYTDQAVKVKNSWGPNWGASGFIQLSTNGNTCGMYSDASYPVVSGSVAV